MVAQNRATLKAEFETGDVPDGTDYGNLIDSFVSLTDTSAQTVASPMTFSGSAAFTGTVTAASIEILGALRVSAATSLQGSLSLVTAQTTATASGAVGGSVVPTTATRYLKVSVSGVTYNVPLYPSV